MPRPGVEDRLLSPRRAPASRHVDGLAHRARCRVLPTIAYPTAFLVQQPGTVARYTSPSQVRTYVIWLELNKMAFCGSCCGIPGWRLRSI